MGRTSSNEQLITDLLFGDLTGPEKERIDQLIDAGEVDAAEIEGLRQTLAVASMLDVEEPPSGFWDSYYARVAQRVNAAQAKRLRTVNPARWISEQLDQLVPRARLAAGAALAVVLLVVGVLLGRTVLAPSNETAPMASTDVLAQSDQVTTAAQQYLGRSKVLFLGIVHADSGSVEDLDLSRRRDMARELVRTAADLKPSLDNAELRRLHELVSDIEVILLQIANLEAEYDLPAIEMVRDGVERKGLLFKIYVEEMRLPERRGKVRSNQRNTKRS